MSNQTLGYEVHVMRRGRWEIHATYPSEQRRVAVRDAKSLDKISTISGARVIREFIDKATKSPKDQVIFISPRLEKQMRDDQQTATELIEQGLSLEVTGGVTDPNERGHVGGGSTNAAASDERSDRAGNTRVSSNDGEEPLENAPVRSEVSAVALIIRLASVSIVSLLIATTVAGVLSIILTKSDALAQMMSQATRNNVLFGTFIVTFLLSAFPMAIKYVGRLSGRMIQDQAIQSKVRKRDRSPKTRIRAGALAPTRMNQNEAVPAKPDAVNTVAGLIETGVVRDMAQRLRDALQSGLSLAPRTYFVDVPKLADFMSDEVRDTATELEGFLKRSSETLPEDDRPMDNVTRFGISLYLAGAVEAQCKTRGLGDGDRQKVLAHAVQSLGFGRSQALNFSEKCDQYLLADPKYIQMYQSGRDAMNMEADKEVAAVKMLGRAIEEWNAPKNSSFDQVGRTVVVLFTDMVGSTDMTQTLGDHGAQEILRLHNRIVRDALTVYHGREVKHTGDGIMAAFENASDAIEGAIAIQESIVEHISRTPNLPLKIKIGINAGEAILEDDDIFGSTVQIAARIVDQATAGQILISDLTRGLSAGRKIPMRAHGEASMKGVHQPIALFEVLWGESAKSANQPAVAGAEETQQQPTKSEPEKAGKQQGAS